MAYVVLKSTLAGAVAGHNAYRGRVNLAALGRCNSILDRCTAKLRDKARIFRVADAGQFGDGGLQEKPPTLRTSVPNDRAILDCRSERWRVGLRRARLCGASGPGSYVPHA